MNTLMDVPGRGMKMHREKKDPFKKILLFCFIFFISIMEACGFFCRHLRNNLFNSFPLFACIQIKKLYHFMTLCLKNMK